MDIEWVLDQAFPFPKNNFLVQARPITKVGKKKDAVDKILDMMLGGKRRALVDGGLSFRKTKLWI